HGSFEYVSCQDSAIAAFAHFAANHRTSFPYAVFPLDLLRVVGRRRKARSHEPVDSGVNRKSRAYPLSGLVYCAHCEKLAQGQDDPRLRCRFTGTTYQEGFRRYEHKTGVKCGCHNRTAPVDQVEADFEKLIQLLTIREEAVEYMTELV